MLRERAFNITGSGTDAVVDVVPQREPPRPRRAVLGEGVPFGETVAARRSEHGFTLC